MRKLKGLFKGLGNNFAFGTSFIEIHGTSDLVISGCRRILEYTKEKVCCKTISGVCVIEGSDLKVDIFSGDILTVCGSIKGVKLCSE